MIINDNGITIYTANIKFNVNNSIIIIEILKSNTSTITNHKRYPNAYH